MIKLNTNMGTITIELDFDNAPKTAANFQQYVEDGFYDGKIFHRVIDNFMVQGGGFDVDMNESQTRAAIENEADNGLKNENGTLAMARTGDPHSASSQFFINVTNNDFLNHSGKNPQGWGYAVFGKVVDGLDVVEAMKAVSTGSHGHHQDVPREAIIIETAVVAD
ncbi:MAG: peptidylprolyl isomerase [Pseudomonadales bacterium]|nr:peptidylprolyl isomerase [Pseudomonadales bacterium]MDB2409398.1 peptidylprolyl isomerase [Pseudomonadales bacterium]MDG1937742.1 peptidylprolyl isomerase [Pseudomonadales bacterium]MDG2035754.1 peptidylprolyl isomerase [Pseudomonadales bacterium]